jgi:hypothetical protein
MQFSSPYDEVYSTVVKACGAGSQLPFDVSAFRVLFYDDSIGGKPKLEEGLRRHLEEILGEPRPWNLR